MKMYCAVIRDSDGIWYKISRLNGGWRPTKEEAAEVANQHVDKSDGIILYFDEEEVDEDILDKKCY